MALEGGMWEKRFHKRGQDLSIGTLILIVLGIVVLVLLILGFSLGWSNLWEKINIFQGGSSIESVVQACNIAVSSQATYSYCNTFHKIKIDGVTEYVNCLDSRVQLGLGEKLECGNVADLIREKCESLKLTAEQKRKVKVNGASCPGATNVPAVVPGRDDILG